MSLPEKDTTNLLAPNCADIWGLLQVTREPWWNPMCPPTWQHFPQGSISGL